MNKYFVWHWDEGFETFDSEQKAKDRAHQLFDADYEASCTEGFDEECFQVSWGVIAESSIIEQTGEKTYFDGAMVDAVDAKMIKV